MPVRPRSFPMPPLRASAAAYAAVTALLVPWPVVGVLHAESSAVVAATAFVVAVAGGLAAFRREAPLGRTLGAHVALLAIPLAGLTLSLAWRPNCAYLTGLGLFAVMVPPSAVLGVALAYALAGVRRAGWIAAAVGVMAVVGGVVSDLAVHPQLYTYNHVFGGVLGPIYDEELSIRPGLVAFRALTLLGAAWLVALGRWRRGGGRPTVLVGAAVAGALGVGYLAAVPLGIQQTPARLERALGSVVVAGPFRIVYDADATPPAAVRRAADDALWAAHRLTQDLGVTWREPVTIVLYPDPETKGALIGSRVVSVTPTWLRRPQVHMLADEVPRSLSHELAHVAARTFGMPGVRASPAVGLVEGLAVAVEGPDGGPSPEALVAAARALPGDAGGLDADPAAVVLRTMDPVGFWTARASVAYTAGGAFTRWLLDTHGAAPVREAYRTGRFRPAFGVPLDTLTARWGRHLATVPVTDEARETAAWAFRQPSLFERPCPHHVPRHERDARDGWHALAAGDTTAAGAAFRASLTRRPTWPDAVSGAALLRAAAQGRAPVTRAVAGAFAARLDSTATPGALAAVADLHRLAGLNASADTLYARAARATAPSDRWSRLLLARRAALGADALARLRASPADLDATARSASDPVLALALWRAAGRPDAAWRAARAAWRTPVRTAQRRTLALAVAGAAYDAGATTRAGHLAAWSARSSEQAGEASQAAVAADLAARVRWRVARAADRGADVARSGGPSPPRR